MTNIEDKTEMSSKPRMKNSAAKQKPKGGNVKRMKRRNNTGGALISAIIVAVMLFSGYMYIRNEGDEAEEVKLSEVVSMVKENPDDVKEVTVKENRVTVTKENDDEVFAFFDEDTEFTEILENEDIVLSDTEIEYTYEPVTNIAWLDIVSLLFMAGLAVAVFFFVKNMQSSGSKFLDFGRSKAKLIFGKKSDVGFDDVAGIKESKEELIEVVDFLKNPKKFTKLGARVPKGVLLVGPPGSGKTLLAKAVAGEAEVPFFHTSGSEFEEMLVGAGASRVRDLFQKARKASPCIIFIDEIDAVAKKRGTTLHSGNTEQTLNQILVEMDGLEPRVNVIVMAATNRPDVLDPAILRPGRFDRHVVLNLPDVNEREQILEIHARNKKLAKDVNLESVAKRTVGFSGADLENTLNEAAIIAAGDDKEKISQKDIDEAALKVRYGREKKSKKREEEDIKMTAYHEAGHALVAHYTPAADPVHGVSIISRGMTGGMTMFLPEKERENQTQKRMMAKITVSTGGNVAESVVFDDVSTGAASDVKNASEIARDMVKRYGMSEKLGFVQYGDMDESEMLGYGYETKDYSDETARDIDLEVKRIVQSAWQAAEKILKEHRDKLDALAELLLEKEVIDDKEFNDFFKDFEEK